jgi:hypothetical protein
MRGMPVQADLATESPQRSVVALRDGLVIQVHGSLGCETILYFGLLSGVSWSHCQQIDYGESAHKEHSGSEDYFIHKTTPWDRLSTSAGRSQMDRIGLCERNEKSVQLLTAGA